MHKRACEFEQASGKRCKLTVRDINAHTAASVTTIAFLNIFPAAPTWPLPSHIQDSVHASLRLQIPHLHEVRFNTRAHDGEETICEYVLRFFVAHTDFSERRHDNMCHFDRLLMAMERCLDVCVPRIQQIFGWITAFVILTHECVSYRFFQTCLRLGAHVDEQVDIAGCSALMRSCMTPDQQVTFLCMQLIQHGADLELYRNKSTPLLELVRHARYDVLLQLHVTYHLRTVTVGNEEQAGSLMHVACTMYEDAYTKSDASMHPRRQIILVLQAVQEEQHEYVGCFVQACLRDVLPSDLAAMVLLYVY
jgi:hypothetical protein